MKNILWVFLTISTLFVILSTCGEKIDLPTEAPFQGDLGDTLYLQLNPPWDAESGYEFDNPQAVYFGKDTYLYVADTGNDRILQMDAAGTIHDIISIENPISISQDELMRLLVVTGTQKIYKIDMGPGGDHHPYIAYDYAAITDPLAKDHALLNTDDVFVSVTDFLDNIKTYLVAVKSGDSTGGNGRVLWFWGSVNPDSSDSLFDPVFTNAASDTLFNPIVETGNGITTINYPNHIFMYALGTSVHLIVCQDSGSYPIHDMVYEKQVWDNHWVFNYSHYPGEGDILNSDLYDMPKGATIDAEGNIFMVDGGQNRTCGGMKFSRTGMLLNTFCEPDSVDNVFIRPSSITYDLYGNRKTVFIADAGKNAILRFKLSTDLEN